MGEGREKMRQGREEEEAEKEKRSGFILHTSLGVLRC